VATSQVEPFAMMGLSNDFLSNRELLRIEECFHQIAFSADNHLWEALEPFLVRYFRLGVEHSQRIIQVDLPKSRGYESGRGDDAAAPAEDFAAGS
jgi:hypothetical protein